MKIYTRNGDAGQTDLFAGGRVPKDHPRVEALGEMDEFNCSLGVLRSHGLPPEIDALVEAFQRKLFMIGSEFSCPIPEKLGLRSLVPEEISFLEEKIDYYSENLRPLKGMLCPVGNRASVFCQLARAVCRRVERRLITAVRESEEDISPLIPQYFNRLSDLLFVLGRFLEEK